MGETDHNQVKYRVSGRKKSLNECVPRAGGFASSFALGPLRGKVRRFLYARFTDEEPEDEAER